jgi:hypothetical protein
VPFCSSAAGAAGAGAGPRIGAGHAALHRLLDAHQPQRALAFVATADVDLARPAVQDLLLVGFDRDDLEPLAQVQAPALFEVLVLDRLRRHGDGNRAQAGEQDGRAEDRGHGRAMRRRTLPRPAARLARDRPGAHRTGGGQRQKFSRPV